jgi:hypothetical protein
VGLHRTGSGCGALGVDFEQLHKNAVIRNTISAVSNKTVARRVFIDNK